MTKFAAKHLNSGPVAGPAGTSSPEVGAGEANVGMTSVGDGQSVRAKRLMIVQLAMLAHNHLADLVNDLSHRTDRTHEEDELLGRYLCEGSAIENVIESVAADIGLRLNKLDANPAAVRH